MRVLVVDDAPEYRELVATVLAGEGLEVDTAADGEEALELIRARGHELVVLDVQLPKLDGTEVCRRLRAFSDAYVIMLTARGDEIDRVLGLTVGADDYVTKPFSPRELVARVQALRRRPRSAATFPRDDGVRRLGRLEVDTFAREVRLDGAPVALTPLEYGIVDALSENPRLTLSRQQLLDRVWGEDWFGDDHVVDVHVSNLRRKVEDDPSSPRVVVTVRGFGYRLGRPEDARGASGG